MEVGIDLINLELGLTGEGSLHAHAKDGLLLVGPRAEYDRRTTSMREYEMPWINERTLQAQQGQSGGRSVRQSVGSTLDLVTSMIEPEAWRTNGGALASARLVGTTLFVSAPARLHEEVEQMMGTLHKQHTMAEARQREAQQREAELRERRLNDLVEERDELSARLRDVLARSTRDRVLMRGDELTSEELAAFEVEHHMGQRDIKMIENALDHVEEQIIRLRYIATPAARNSQSPTRGSGRGQGASQDPGVIEEGRALFDAIAYALRTDPDYRAEVERMNPGVDATEIRSLDGLRMPRPSGFENTTGR